jgi:hypothetical protein
MQTRISFSLRTITHYRFAQRVSPPIIYKNLHAKLIVDLHSPIKSLEVGKEVAGTGHIKLEFDKIDYWVKLVLVKSENDNPLRTITVIYCPIETTDQL